MKVIISAEDEGKSILTATLTFSDKEEGLGVAHMLQAFARNRWQSYQDEQTRKATGRKPELANPTQSI